MSTMMMDVRPVARGGDTVGMFGAAAGGAHPRGQGFRVLSRIARTQASDEDYAPRHRLDAEPDCFPDATR